MIITALIACLLSGFIASGTAPTESQLLGTWGYSGNSFVIMENNAAQATELPTPAKSDVDSHLSAMGASHSNLTLTFTEGHKATLKLGDNAIDLDWELNASTKVFKASVGPFSIKGYLVKKGDRIALAYTRPNLFMIMRYLCTSTGKKHIAPLGTLLDCTKGLSLAMEFTM